MTKGTTIKDRLMTQVYRLAQRDYELEKESRRLEAESRQRSKDAGRWIGFCRPADSHAYHQWLASWIEAGNTVTHLYDYQSNRWDWRVVERSIEITPLYGAMSVNLVAPKGISVTGEPGHSSVFMMDGPTTDGFCIPCFSDTPAALEALEQRK